MYHFWSLSIQYSARADYILKIQLLSYASLPHRKYDGFCCGAQDASGCIEHCNNMFTFCLRPTGFHEESDTCQTDQKLVTGPISNDSMVFESGVDLYPGIPNPMIYTGERWLVSIVGRDQLVMQCNRARSTVKINIHWSDEGGQPK